MDNCRISCQVMVDMKKVYDDLINMNLYLRHVGSGGAGGGSCITTCPPPRFLDFATCLYLGYLKTSLETVET